MCGLCGILADTPHFTEGGSDAARTDMALSSARERHLARDYRVRLLNRALRFHGYSLRDWAGHKYVLTDSGGRTALIDSLPQVWLALESLMGKPADPLDPELIAALSTPARP